MSSAAAGVSLVAASLVLVIGVSALIGFRGFRSARQAPVEQRVVLSAPSTDRERGATPVVIGGEKAPAARSAAPARKRRATSRSTRSRTRTRTARKPARSGLSAPARRRPAQPVAPAAEAPQQEPAPVAPEPAATAAPVADPVGQVLEDVGKIVEKPTETVGDVLLDLRDALP